MAESKLQSEGAAQAGRPSVTRSQELVYELKIGDIMTPDPITVQPDCTMRELKEILRIRRISGVPVVQDGALQGIISLEDLILALERGEIGTRVGDRMTRRVQTVYSDESAVSYTHLTLPTISPV